MTDDPYVYPGTNVLKNKLAIADARALEAVERQLVVQRIRRGVPTGQFDLAHLQDIHRHLFQDVYAWAGELRTVEISKGGSQFQFRRFVETGMSDIHRRLVGDNYLKNLSAPEFSLKAGEIIGDVNYVHPFREGNGRAQILYLEQLAAQAGHPIEPERLQPQQWIEASRAAHDASYLMMADAIRAALVEP